MNMDFRSRAVTLAAIGVAEGVIIGVLITATLTSLSMGDGTVYLCTPDFTRFIGDPLLAFVVEAVLSGVLGAVAMGTSAIYYIEEWSIIRATATHFIITMTTYFAVAFFCRWLHPRDIGYNLIIFSILVIVYTFIWLYNYLTSKNDVEEINKELAEWKLAVAKEQ